MLEFDPASHTYKNPVTNEKYLSATTLIGKFKKPFELEKMSKLVADREGVSQDEIKERWKTVNKQACDYGSSIHLVMENWLHDKDITSEEKKLYTDPIERIWQPDRSKIEPEKKLWLHEYKIAGTTDVYETQGKYLTYLILRLIKSLHLLINMGIICWTLCLIYQLVNLALTLYN